MASRIEDYGLIGNMRTAALVSRQGSIDWFGGPRFDSDACFAALIGYDEHGRWQIRPTVAIREIKQRYRGDTMILETEFFCDSGAVRIIDFMPMGRRGRHRCDLVRIVEGLRRRGPGRDAAGRPLWLRQGHPLGHAGAIDGMRFTAGPDTLVFRAPIEIQPKGARLLAYLNVKKGDRIPLQLNLHPSHEPVPPMLATDDVLASTECFWRGWAGRCTWKDSCASW